MIDLQVTSVIFMATTLDFPITDNLWQIIATGVESGYISNEGDVQLIVREAPTITPPTVNVGHRINNYDDDGFYYTLQTGQSLYIKRAQESFGNKALALKTVNS